MSTEKILGDAITARLAKAKLDPRARSAAKTFAAQHTAYGVLLDAAVARGAARAAALAAIGETDERLDAQIARLADVLPAAGLSKRGQPFAGFSKHAPTALCDLGYTRQLDETAKLVKAVRKAKPGADVLAVCSAIDREAAALKKLLPAYDAAQKAWLKAVAARDALLPDWQKALTRLRVLARASLVDQPGGYEAIFARPESIAVAKRPRKKPAAAPGREAPASE